MNTEQTSKNIFTYIKEQDSQLKKEEMIANQCTKKLQTLTNES